MSISILSILLFKIQHKLLGGVPIAAGGVLQNIHAVLLPKKPSTK